jgi:butyryl-CoA dehydrogenase
MLSHVATSLSRRAAVAGSSSANGIARRAITTHSQLPEEHKMIYDMCRNFADEQLAPNAKEWDQKHMFPKDAVHQLYELGLMGICTPDTNGGSGLDAMSYAIAMEEISRGCASVGVILSAHNSLYLYPVQAYGTPQQHDEWITPYVDASNPKLGCFGLSEPGNGSDAGAAKTTATKDGSDWIINGTKVSLFVLMCIGTKKSPVYIFFGRHPLLSGF